MTAKHISGGYIQLARKLIDSEIWSEDPHMIRLWVYLLLSARWDPTPKTIGDVTVSRGQVLRSYRRIAEDNEWTENNALKRWSMSRVGRMLDWLETEKMISRLGTGLGTLITIQNFNDYQDSQNYGEEFGTEPGTRSGHRRDNRNKDKKGNTDREPELFPEDSGDSPPPQQRKKKHALPPSWKPNEKHQAQATKLRLDVKSEVENFRDHATANGRTMVDWNAAFRMWLKKSAEFRGDNGPPKKDHSSLSGMRRIIT